MRPLRTSLCHTAHCLRKRSTSGVEKPVVRISVWSMHRCIPTSRPASWSTTSRQKRLSDESSWSMAASWIRPDHLPRYPHETAESVRNFREVHAPEIRRHKKGSEERRGKFVISHPIEDRPASATNRSVRGHWEADTVVGKQGKACLVTLVDRKSRYLLGGKAMSKTAVAVNKVMCEALSGQPHLSVTPDRGKEFSKHAQLKKELKRVTFYFPVPHHPWERGPTRIPMGFCESSSRRARTSRTHQRITSNGSTMS